MALFHMVNVKGALFLNTNTNLYIDVETFIKGFDVSFATEKIVTLISIIKAGSISFEKITNIYMEKIKDNQQVIVQ